MALIKSEEQKEIQQLQEIERRIARRERREKIHHLLIAGLGLLTVGAFFTGRCGRKR